MELWLYLRLVVGWQVEIGMLFSKIIDTITQNGPNIYVYYLDEK